MVSDMKELFDKLTDSIAIINNEEKVLFINKSFLTNMGYEERELDLNKINNLVKIKNNKITIFCNDKVIKEGIGEGSSISWHGEEAKAVVVRWKKHIEDHVKLELIEKLLDQLSEWICIRNRNNELIYINKACADFYNTTKDEAMAIIEEQFINSPIREVMVKKDDYLVQQKKSCSYEIESEKDGFKIYYEVKKYPILNAQGEVEYTGVAVNDISLQKNMQYKILDNLNFIDGNDENGNLKMFKVDESIFSNFKLICERFLNISKINILIYDKDTKELKPVFPFVLMKKEIINRDYLSLAQDEIDKLFSGAYKNINKLTSEELGIVGEDKIYYIANYPIINQGEFKGLITMRFDEYPANESVECFIKTICSEIGFIIRYIELSNKINAELNYRSDIESELEAFLEVSSDFVLKADKSGLRDVSKRCFDILGWTREEILNMKYEELIHPEDLNRTLEFMKKQYETNERLQWENRIKCSNGRGKWISWRSRNLIDSKGYVFVSGKDITCEKVIEEQEKEIEKTKQLEAVRNEFFANISHEFKTPINMIMTTTQLMSKQLQSYELNNSLKAEIERYVSIYKQNGYRLLRLVNNLIDITKIDSGFYKIKPVNVNIINVIEDIVLSVVNYCEGNKIELIFDTEAEEEIIACDPDQIERIILNLISNAIKYTPENGQIRVNINIEEEFVAVEVKDTGTGIPKEKLDMIFERFVQGEGSLTRPCEGSGIGLSLVKGLVEIHGGNVSVSSEVGHGSTFKVSLPRKQVPEVTVNPAGQCEIKQSKIEKCSIEFADIYNL